MNKSNDIPSITVCADTVAQALGHSVHFSFKTTNSNIDGGGIRLSQEQALDLPYVSARTLLADGVQIPLDYHTNGTVASTFKAIKAATLNSTDSDFTSESLDQIRQQLEGIKHSAFATGTDQVSIRMRQLLIPQHESDQYVSFSPLTAAGVCALINQTVGTHNLQFKSLNKEERLGSGSRRLITAHLGIGGSNPQNVGAWVREMQRPLFVGAPKNNSDLRHAIKVFYQGFSWFVPSDLLDEYAKLLADALTQGKMRGLENGIKAQDMETRLDEKHLLRRITRYVLAQGEEKKQLLDFFADKLPSVEQHPRVSFWVDDQVSLIIRGLLDPEHQHDQWKNKFSKQLAAQICNTKTKLSDGTVVRLTDLDTDAHGFLARKIMKGL